MSVDPLYCDPTDRDLTLRDDSPCLPENNPWSALIGAHGAGGCGTSAGEGEPLASRFRLAPPFPNPAAGSVELGYELADAGAPVEITILTVDGRHVRRLRDTPESAGIHGLIWDGTDEGGRPVASGVYLIRGRAAGHSSYRGLVMLRR
jgi:flagellar hook assembly protein FlgD